MIRVGDTGVDFSYAKPPAARLIELGHSFIVGYISVPPASPGKNLTVAQYDSYAALERFLVWEMTAIRASLGAGVGAQDGRDAARMAGERHYPLDKPILAADDTNTVGSNIDAQEAYMRAFAEWCKPWPMGIYGDVDILERCQGLWVLGWVPNAWAWSGLSRANAEAKAARVGAHVLQHKGFYIDNMWAVDPNVVIRDFASTPQPPPPQPPTGVDDDMLYCEDADEGQFWAIFFDAYANRVACPLNEMPDFDWNEFAAVQAALGPLKKVPHAALQRLYDKRGKPQLPPISGKLTDHDHNVDEIVATTTISGRTGGVIP